MKKVYLIDDNSKKQRDVYGATFVDDNVYDDCLVHIERLNGDSDFSFLQDAACIMVHDSLEDWIDEGFHHDSHKAKERIEDYLLTLDVPNVLFSDGHPIHGDWSEARPNVVSKIKKSEFYLNLRPFLDLYRSSGTLDLRIIAFGKEFIRHFANKYGQVIASQLLDINGREPLQVESMDKNARIALRHIIEYGQPQLSKTFDEVMAEIEDGDITVEQLMYNINNVVNNINKYGKNISPWK